MCSDDVVGSASAQNGAQAVGSATGSPNGRPPSGRDTPASQSHSSAARGLVVGRGVLEHLEGVHGPDGLALDRPQVGLDRAVAAVGVAKRLERSEGGGGIGAVEPQGEPPALEQAGVAGHEPGGGSEVDGGSGHASDGARDRHPAVLDGSDTRVGHDGSDARVGRDGSDVVHG